MWPFQGLLGLLYRCKSAGGGKWVEDLCSSQESVFTSSCGGLCVQCAVSLVFLAFLGAAGAAFLLDFGITVVSVLLFLAAALLLCLALSATLLVTDKVEGLNKAVHAAYAKWLGEYWVVQGELGV
jgi:hypothetical protein